jgi:imidazolonepropionase-like amidohydrolase
MEELTKILDQAGVPLIFGTDTGPSLTVPGETVLWEIDLLQKAGLSNYKILQSATKNAAEVLNNDQLGVIKPGAISDMIILKNNPLENAMAITELESTVQGNKYYNKESLKSLRAIGEDKQTLYQALGNFLEHLKNK